MKIQVLMVLLLAAGTAMAQRSQSGGRQAPSAAELIAKLDKDGDGKISSTEFDGPAEHFTRFDANSDGYITESEVPSGPPQGGRQGGQQGGPRGGGQDEDSQSGASFVTRLDKDGDGKVSASEFDGPSEAFSQLDTDNDGYLSDSEAPSGPPSRGGRQ